MNAAAGGQSKYQCVDDANHFYNRHTPQIVEMIHQWLGQVAAK